MLPSKKARSVDKIIVALPSEFVSLGLKIWINSPPGKSLNSKHNATNFITRSQYINENIKTFSILIYADVKL